MTERITARSAAALLLPLLAVAAVAPAGLDRALHPLLAGGLPLAWAALWSILGRSKYRGMGAAILAALPFTALSLASFSTRPFAAQFLALAACCMAMAAVDSVPRRANTTSARRALRPREGDRLGRLLASAAAVMPGLLLAAFTGPWSGVAVSGLLTVSALYLRQRRLR